MVGKINIIVKVPSARKLSQGRRIKFGEWCSFSDLDNFNSDYLIATLTTQVGSNTPFLWTSSEVGCKQEELPLIALRQAESVFNLSQLMFALYHGSVSACTFLDLQHNQPPRDIRKHGFAKLDNYNIQSGSVFRQALHSLCWNIAESGGLPVIFSMMKNPALPIIRQKCLDALTNILCVDNIEKIVLQRQHWFLEKLVSMVSKGDLQCDMVPAISVLDRLVVVILSERMREPYEQLLRYKFVETCLSRLQCSDFTCPSLRLHFVKFQTIAMQAVALLCADEQSINWPSELQESVFMYCFRSVLLWNTDHPPSDPVWHQSESFYRSMSFSSSALLFSFVVLVHAVLKWSHLVDFLRSQALAFKYQLSKIMTLQGISAFDSSSDPNGPAIMNTVEWLWNRLYTTGYTPLPAALKDTNGLYPSVLDPLSELCEKVLRLCSNSNCSNREDSVGSWETCSGCNMTCYCSEACRVKHTKEAHNTAMCSFLAMKDGDVKTGDSPSSSSIIT